MTTEKFIDVLIDVWNVRDWDYTISHTNNSGNADITIDHRYKKFTIQIHKQFYVDDLKYRADTLIHEFCHFFNLPVANLVGESRNGNLITDLHLDDVLENANVHAENTLVKLLTDDTLRKAYHEYVYQKMKPRSVKRRPKLTKKK